MASNSGGLLLPILAAMSAAEDLKEKEDRELQEAINASLADTASGPPQSCSDSGPSTTGESSRTASKRRASDGESNGEADSTPRKFIKVTHNLHDLLSEFASACGDSKSVEKDGSNQMDPTLAHCLVSPDSISTTFKDVHMSPDVIQDLEILKLTIERPSEFSYGILSRCAPPGILLYGAPGTGKTLLARALAKHTHAKMIALSGADIRSKYVGEGERRISEIFSFARKNHPCMIFIDEADALFHSRSSEANSKGHLADINQFLTEMDGINSKGRDSPIVIAATNRPFDLDEGIMRRLGKRILIDIPDVAAREEILKIQLQGETLAADVDLAELAKATPEYTGSDLKDLIYEAAILAVRQGLHRSHAYPPPPSAPESSRTPSSDDPSHRIICKTHLIEAKHTVHPSPKSETMSKIREFHSKFGSMSQGKRKGGVHTFNKTKGVVSE